MSQKAIEWIRDQVTDWRDKFFLEGWSIRVSSALCVERDPDVIASARVTSAYNTALLTFRADVENGDEAEETIIHEVLHIAHGRIDAVVEGMIIPRLPTESQPLAIEVYRQVNESFITNLAITLRNQQKGTCNDGSKRSDNDTVEGSGGIEPGSTTSTRKGRILVSNAPQSDALHSVVCTRRSVSI